MRLRNILITVKDAEASARYYNEVFGLVKVLDQGGNIMMSEGLVLQEERLWGLPAGGGRNSCEIYFEEGDIEAFAEKLERLNPHTEFVQRLTELPDGRRMMRFRDPDGNLIEVRNPR